MTSHKAENSITDQECDSAEVGERQRSSCARASRSQVKEPSQGAKRQGVKLRSQASRSQVKEPSRGAKSPGYVSARLHVAAKDQL